MQIGVCGCTHFIDDLPEFLAEPAFPKNTRKILFSPTRAKATPSGGDVLSFNSWREITEYLLAL